jgi:hypothetical protein
MQAEIVVLFRLLATPEKFNLYCRIVRISIETNEWRTANREREQEWEPVASIVNASSRTMNLFLLLRRLDHQI